MKWKIGGLRRMNLRVGARKEEKPLCMILTPTSRMKADLFCCNTYFTLVPVTKRIAECERNPLQIVRQGDKVRGRM